MSDEPTKMTNEELADADFLETLLDKQYDDYDSEGVRYVHDVSSHYSAEEEMRLKRIASRLRASAPVAVGERVPPSDEPWDLPSILAVLANAADTLFDLYDYDGHGYEEIIAARDAARLQIIRWKKSAALPPPPGETA